MKIETKFSNGDIVYGIQKQYHTDNWHVIGPLTIGQVRIKVTYSYRTEEQYMCVETGIETGTIHPEDQLFFSKAEAKQAAKNRNEKQVINNG